MGLVTRQWTYSAGAIIIASQHNDNENTLYNVVNGNLNTDNLSASAGIVDTQLATISTTGKVNISALTVASQAQGDLIYATSATAWARLAKGTAGQILTMNSGATAPEWGSLSASNALAGSVVQVQYQELVTSSTGTTTIPFDDTIPQNTEGDEYLSKAITPTNTNNILKIDVVVFCGSGSDDSKVVALFKDSDASAIAAGFHRMGINTGGGIKFSHFRTAGSTSAQTFKVRAGGQGGTFRINGADSSRRFGGVLVSSLCITEIKV